jgi:PilZ domain
MSLKHAEHHRPKSHHSHVAAATLSRIQASKRRSSRMALNASVGLSGEDRLRVTFTMPAKATNLNRHGAAVQLSRDLPVGTIVTMKNQRGAEVSARIVSVIAAVQGLSTYGIEFVELDEKAQQFWGISFPKNA